VAAGVAPAVDAVGITGVVERGGGVLVAVGVEDPQEGIAADIARVEQVDLDRLTGGGLVDLGEVHRLDAVGQDVVAGHPAEAIHVGRVASAVGHLDRPIVLRLRLPVHGPDRGGLDLNAVGTGREIRPNRPPFVVPIATHGGASY